MTSGYTKFYGLMQGDIEGFHICHACYEDRVVGTAFQDEFVIIDPIEEDVDLCICDIGCAPYIARVLLTMAKRRNWPGFINCAIKRLSAECCSGSLVQTDSISSWYLPVDVALNDIQICERCYLDQISHGPFEDQFLLYQPSWDDESNEPKFRRCLLDNGDNLGIALALERARQKLDFDIFLEAAKVINSVSWCPDTRTVGCNVWTLSGADFDGFIICESCYTGLSTFGLRHFFRKTAVDSETEIYCRLCSGLPECEGFLLKLAETLDCGMFSYFFDYVKTEYTRDVASDANTDHIKDKENEAAVRMTEYKEKSQSEGLEVTKEEVLILRRCPEYRVIDYSLLWYRLVNPPETKVAFLVCSRCYTDHIHNTSLASEFEPILQPNQLAAACSFWIPSVLDCFWPDAVATGKTDTFRRYVSQWVESPCCPGVQGSRNLSSTWYGMVNSEVDGFMICEGCYVSNVLGTNFQNKFTSYSSEWKSDTWACDLRFAFTSRALRTYTKLNDWNSFVLTAEQRHGLLKCTGSEIYASSVTWFYPRHQPISNMRICAACYMDHWAFTQFEEEFQQEYRGPPLGSDESKLFIFTERWRCHVGNNLSVLMAIQEAKAEKNFDIFTEAITVILESPPCTENGITYGEGWTLLGGCEGFTICHSCYSGIIWSTGLSDFFERISWAQENVTICSFNKSAPRFELVLNKLHESLDRQDFSFFSSFVKQFASLPVCPRNTVYTGRPWWGYPQARCCVECWVDWLSHTPLAATMPLQGAVQKEGAICQMWSPRLRALWLSVCDDGEPGSGESEAAVAKFCEIAREREEIFWKTMPAIKRLRGIKYAANLNIQVQAMASVNYAGMNSMSVVSGMTDGNRYGNSSIGWYDTMSGAAAMQARNSMYQSMDTVSGQDAELYRLETSWREVE